MGEEIHLFEVCRVVKVISFLHDSEWTKSSQNSYTKPSSTEMVQPA
jgi:hypothetical protein